MANNITMQSSDTISAKLANIFVTVGTNRYNLMQMIDFEAKFDKKKATVPILGRTGSGNRTVGWEGTFSGTMHYNTSIFRAIAEKYKDTGEDMYFTIEVSNEDPTSAAGRQSIVFLGCNLNSLVLAKFDAGGEYLDEDFEGTFDDFKMPKQFNVLQGMFA